MIAGELSAAYREEPTDPYCPTKALFSTEPLEHVEPLEPQVLVFAATRPK